MKKTLIALSVLFASSMAHAGVEIYNKDGASVTLTGDLEVYYKKDKEDGSELQQYIDDADFGFDARYAVSDSLTVGGYWEFSGDGGAADTGDMYVGFYMGEHTVKVGKTATILDDTGITEDYNFGVTSFVEDNDLFSGDEVIKYQFDNGSVYGGVAAMQGKTTAKAFDKDEVYVDMNIGVRTDSGFDLSAWYGTVDEFKALAIEAKYAATESLNLGLGFYDVADEGSSIAAAADYTVDKMIYAAGLSMTDYEGGDEVLSMFVNAGYNIAPATVVYAELGMDDKDDSELGYAVGMKVEF